MDFDLTEEQVKKTFLILGVVRKVRDWSPGRTK